MESHPVHLLLEPEEDTRTIEVRAVTDPVEQADEFGLVADVPLHEVIEPHGYQQGSNDHDVQLHINRAARQVADPTAQHDKQIEQQNGKRRGGMRAAQTDKHVMQVRLIGMERRLVLQNAGNHHTKRIEDRNGQNGQHEGDKPDMLRIVDPPYGAVRQRPHHEDRDDDSHDQRTAVTDEHLRGFAKKVVEEEGDERTGSHYGQHGQHPVSDMPEQQAEKEARQNAVARRETVHTIHQIDSVDNAHSSHDRQRHGYVLRDLMNPPQPVKVIQTVAADINQQQYREDLDHETQCGREIEDVVQRSGVEHDHHRHHDDEQLGTVTADAGNSQTDDRSKEDGDTAQHGDRFALQLPRIGIVDDVLVESDLDQPWMDPANAQ